VIDGQAHVRLAHASHNNGAVLLRRGYSFTDGTDSLGRLAAGLFFLAYQRDPRRQFVAIQRSLAGQANDALNEYIQHVGSGLFACPPGVQAGQHWGQALFR
jgi:deferrochelatase/peroxidase EfeB